MWTISPTDTLFLDRDGVINQKIENGYVLSWSQFQFLPNAIAAIAKVEPMFSKIIGVTNQQAIDKRMMLETDLIAILKQMADCIEKEGGRLDAFYYCPHLAGAHCGCRKPNIGMAKQALGDYPSIQFEKSFMVGDSISDMQFGRNCGMKTIFVSNDHYAIDKYKHLIDANYPSLFDFASDCQTAQ